MQRPSHVLIIDQLFIIPMNRPDNQLPDLPVIVKVATYPENFVYGCEGHFFFEEFEGAIEGEGEKFGLDGASVEMLLVGWLVLDGDDDVVAKVSGWFWSFRRVVSRSSLMARLGRGVVLGIKCCG